MTHRLGSAIVALALGCTSVRVIESDAGGGGARAGDAAIGAGGGGACDLPASERLAIADVRDATQIGTVLHVEATIDGAPGYALLDLSARPPHLLARREDLAGGARWTPLGGKRFARVVEQRVDVLDAGDPREPVLAASWPLDGTATGSWAGVWTSFDDAAYLCLARDDGESTLTRVALTDPSGPTLSEVAPFSCDWLADHASAERDLWVFWHSEGAVSLFDLGAGATTNSHSFNPSGVHHYGGIRRVATDGEVAVAELENPAYAFVYYRAPNAVVYSSFGSGEKAVLGVVAGQALVAFAGDPPRLASFDLTTPPASEQPAASGALTVTLPEAASDISRWRLLASREDGVILTDGGALYSFALDAQGALAPLAIARSAMATCGP